MKAYSNLTPESGGISTITNNPISAFFHFIFKITSFTLYLVGNFVLSTYITIFVTVLILATIDFWVVKNVTGRFLVGMRWWNLIDDNGNSRWIFENRKHQISFAELPSKSSKAIFWAGIWSFTFIWTFITAMNFIFFRWAWLALTAILAGLNWANAVGYFYCDRDSNTHENFAQSFLKNSIFDSVKNKFMNTS